MFDMHFKKITFLEMMFVENIFNQFFTQTFSWGGEFLMFDINFKKIKFLKKNVSRECF